MPGATGDARSHSACCRSRQGLGERGCPPHLGRGRTISAWSPGLCPAVLPALKGRAAGKCLCLVSLGCVGKETGRKRVWDLAEARRRAGWRCACRVQRVRFRPEEGYVPSHRIYPSGGRARPQTPQRLPPGSLCESSRAHSCLQIQIHWSLCRFPAATEPLVLQAWPWWEQGNWGKPRGW